MRLFRPFPAAALLSAPPASSLPYDDSLDVEDAKTTRAVFFGLGSDGTVSANKNSIKILGDAGRHAQGYFVLDTRYRVRVIKDRWMPQLERALAEVTLAIEEQEIADAARLRLGPDRRPTRPRSPARP